MLKYIRRVVRVNMEEIRVNRNDGNDNCIVAFVFSCPGQREEKSGLLVRGTTGNNLDLLLNSLHDEFSQIFHSANRYDYRITNASDIVHYKAHDNRTEATKTEIKQPENCRRLYEDLNGFEYIIAFGDKAIYAVSLLASRLGKSKIINCKYHLGMQSINRRITKDIHGKTIVAGQKDNTAKRIEVVKRNIVEQL